MLFVAVADVEDVCSSKFVVTAAVASVLVGFGNTVIVVAVASVVCTFVIAAAVDADTFAPRDDGRVCARSSGFASSAPKGLIPNNVIIISGMEENFLGFASILNFAASLLPCSSRTTKIFLCVTSS